METTNILYLIFLSIDFVYILYKRGNEIITTKTSSNNCIYHKFIILNFSTGLFTYFI